MNEQVELIFEMFKEDANKKLDFLKSEFAGIKAGRANPAILNKVMVDYYGVKTPINQMANVSVPEARMIVIAPWDVSQIREITKAILASDIGLTPSDDGKVIRLIFPILTEERRKELCKQVRKISEDAKVGVRNVRREALDELKKLLKDKLLGEDEFESLEKEVQKITDGFIANIDALTTEKETDIMKV